MMHWRRAAKRDAEFDGYPWLQAAICWGVCIVAAAAALSILALILIGVAGSLRGLR